MSLIGTCESLAVPQLRGADDQLLNRLCACAPDFESVTAGSGKIFLQRYLPSSHWPDRKSRSAAISLPRRCMLLALPKQGLTAHRRADSGSNSSISPPRVPAVAARNSNRPVDVIQGKKPKGKKHDQGPLTVCNRRVTHCLATNGVRKKSGRVWICTRDDDASPRQRSRLPGSFRLRSRPSDAPVWERTGPSWCFRLCART